MIEYVPTVDYPTVEDWARDSDYRYCDGYNGDCDKVDGCGWMNENGWPVDILVCWHDAMDAAGYVGEDGEVDYNLASRHVDTEPKIKVYTLVSVDADSWSGGQRIIGIFRSVERAEKWLEDNRAHSNYEEGDERNYWWRSLKVADPTWKTTNSLTGEPWVMYPERVIDWRYFHINEVEVM